MQSSSYCYLVFVTISICWLQFCKHAWSLWLRNTFFTAFSGSLSVNSSTTTGEFGQEQTTEGFLRKADVLFNTTSRATENGIKFATTTSSASEYSVLSLFLVLHWVSASGCMYQLLATKDNLAGLACVFELLFLYAYILQSLAVSVLMITQHDWVSKNKNNFEFGVLRMGCLISLTFRLVCLLQQVHQLG